MFGPDATMRSEVLAEIERRVAASVRVSFLAGEDSDSSIWQTLATAPLSGSATRLVVVTNPERIKDWSGLFRFVKDKASFSETVLVLLSERAEAGARVRVVDPLSPRKMIWETQLTDWEKAIRDYSAGTFVVCSTPSVELPATGDRGGVGALSPLARWLSLRVEMTQAQAEYLWARCGSRTSLARDVVDQLRLAGVASTKHRGMSEFRAAVDSVLTAHGSEDFAEHVLFGRKQLALLSLVEHEFSVAEWNKILGYLSQRLDWLEPLHIALATSEKLDQVQRRLKIHRKWILQYAHREDQNRNIARSYDRPRVMRCRTLLADLDSSLSSSRGVPVGFGEVLVSAW